MKIFKKLVYRISSLLTYLSLLILALLMFLVTAGVLLRLLNRPLVGEIEMAEILHFVVIMFSFAFVQLLGAHISVGIVVERFPARWQGFMDRLAHLLTCITTCFISYIFFTESLVTTKTSLILNFPFSLLKMIAALGFFIWGLVAFIQVFEGGRREEVSEGVE